MIKPLKVRVKRLRLDPDTFRKWKMEMKKDAEIVDFMDNFYRGLYDNFYVHLTRVFCDQRY